jgi:hypothetical protein
LGLLQNGRFPFAPPKKNMYWWVSTHIQIIYLST